MRKVNQTSARLRKRLEAFYKVHDPPRAVDAKKIQHTLQQCDNDESKLNMVLDAMYGAQLDVAKSQPVRLDDVATQLEVRTEGDDNDQTEDDEDLEVMLDHEKHKTEVREHAELEVHDDGRLYFDAEQIHVDRHDPFAPVFKVVGEIQERAVPLLLGVILAIILANAAPVAYVRYFGKAHHGSHSSHHAAHNETHYGYNNETRFLGGGGGGGGSSGGGDSYAYTDADAHHG